MLDPGVVGVAGRGDAVFPAGVGLGAGPVLDVEGRVGHDEVGAVVAREFRVLVAGEGVAPAGGEVGVEAVDGEVHLGHPPGALVELLAVDGNVRALHVVGREEFLGLDEHAAGSAAGVVDPAAVRFKDLDEDGATVVCDQLAALKDMPESLHQPLLDGRLEYLAFERGYFTNVPEGWYPISTFRDYGRVRSLNLALPFDGQAKASWDVRVPGLNEAASAAWFAALEQHLMADRFLYCHRWRKGDLLIIDNQRTLHGRRGLLPNTCRKLLRGQVTFEAVASAPGAALGSA